jgi:molybdopterin synthase catalytic subunit
LSVEEVHAALADPAAGGVTVFVGAVRDHDGDQGVVGLSYSAHPTAQQRLAEVVEQVAARHDVIGLAAVHRVGDLDIGDAAVVVGASAVHRGEAFDACRALIDDLKLSVPIWKHQRFADGSDEWVGTP